MTAQKNVQTIENEKRTRLKWEKSKTQKDLQEHQISQVKTTSSNHCMLLSFKKANTHVDAIVHYNLFYTFDYIIS